MSNTKDTIQAIPLDVNKFNLNYSSLIEASAGTGKTYTISYLVLRLLLGQKQISNEKVLVNNGDPISIENILVVTFTNAAASDLRARILERIHLTRVVFEKLSKQENGVDLSQIDEIQKDENLKKLIECYISSQNDKSKACAMYARLLNKAERTIDNAPISTIHSFCNRALNQVYSFEAGKPFNIELSENCQEQEDLARYEIWREIFYKNKYEIRLNTLKDLAENISIDKIKDDVISSLKKVRLLKENKGYYGYSIYGLDKKKDTVENELKYLVSEYEKFDSLTQLILQDDSVRIAIKEVQEITDKYAVMVSDTESDLYVNDKTGKYASIKKNFISVVKAVALLKQMPLDEFDKNLIGAVANSVLIKSPDCKENLRESLFVSRCKTLRNIADVLQFEQALLFIACAYGKVKKEQLELLKSIKLCIGILIIQRSDYLCTKANLISNDEVLRQLAVALNSEKKQSDRLVNLLRTQYQVAMIDEFQDTDPVQFEIFKKLYLDVKDLHNAPSAVCYLIGDPKQSIYAFRGSDINSYNKAKSKVKFISKTFLPESSTYYTLNTNYRSTQNVIQGANAIFEENVDGYYLKPFDFDYQFKKKTENNSESEDGSIDTIGLSNISFNAVDYPSPKNGEPVGSCRFYFDDEYDKEYSTPISNYVNSIDFEGKKVNTRPFKEAIAKALALDVYRCLTHGYINKSSDKSGKRKVRPNDIAILVSDATENKCIQNALAALNVQSVYFSDRASVLCNVVKSGTIKTITPTTEALYVIYFMEAMCNNTNTSVVNRLLGSSLLQDHTINALVGQDNDQVNVDVFDREVSLLIDCYKKWEKFGFISAFNLFIQKHEGIKSRMNKKGGERALSNYFQIADLLQSINSKIKGPQAQLLWFKSEVYQTETSNFSEDETRKHLESEQDLVKIYTIHKSKGLQFPLVFLPYLYKSQTNRDNNENLTFYDATKGVEHVSLAFKYDCSKENSPDKLAKLAAVQEKVRLLYVAVTRAQSANFYYVNNIEKGGKASSALKGIIDKNNDLDFGTLKAFSDPSLFRQIKSTNDEVYTAKNLQNINFINSEKAFFDKTASALPKDQSGTYTLNVLDSDCIDSNFTTTSYSGVTSGAHNQMFANQYEEVYSQDAPKDEPTEELINFTFPKGSNAGNFLHNLMENLMSRSDLDKSKDSDLERFILENTEYDPNNFLSYLSDPEKINSLKLWIREVLNANLVPESANGGKSKLVELNVLDCARELEYFLPCIDFDMDVFNRICAYRFEDIKQSLGYEYDVALPVLKAKSFKGFMKGSLDLVARFNTKDGMKYYLIDYKSNFLGGHFEDYSQENIFKSIFESRYDVQILFYTLTLHRFLKNNIPDYSYEKDFGGVMYLYFRGLKADTPSTSSGVFFTKPKEKIVLMLDRLFNGEEVTFEEGE